MRVYQARENVSRMMKTKHLAIPVEFAVKSNLALPSKTLGLSSRGFFQERQSLFHVFLKLGVAIINEVGDIVECWRLKTGKNVHAKHPSQTLPWAALEELVQFFPNMLRKPLYRGDAHRSAHFHSHSELFFRQPDRECAKWSIRWNVVFLYVPLSVSFSCGGFPLHDVGVWKRSVRIGVRLQWIFGVVLVALDTFCWNTNWRTYLARKFVKNELNRVITIFRPFVFASKISSVETESNCLKMRKFPLDKLTSDVTRAALKNLYRGYSHFASVPLPLMFFCGQMFENAWQFNML